MKTTMGQLLINESLPPELRDYRRKLNKKSVKTLLRRVAEQYPKNYNDIVHALMKIGADVATGYGREASLNLDSLKIGQQAQRLRREIDIGVQRLIARGADDKEVIRYVGRHVQSLRDTNFDEQLKAKNALASQVESGARGNKAQFAAVNVGDMLVMDHRDNVIPIPILHSYAEGLDPVEYWAGSYGARKGMVDLKFATPKGGFLGKQLALAAHRLVVTEHDCGTANGIPIEADDPDNVGALLARSYGDHSQNTVITPKIHKILKRHETVVVRSPLTCQAKGGVCARCVGVRERGKLPDIGDNVGIAAAQAISEPVSQSALSSKHTGGMVGAGPTAAGFDAINQLVQVPKTFKEGAAIATVDGVVNAVEKAPQGGTFVHVAGERHYVAPGMKVHVKKGDAIEAGDVLSEGLPNPSTIVRYKGIGAGRWHFMRHFRNTLKASKIVANRRNIELLSRGLINHVRIVDPDGPPDTLPDDIVEFNTITRGYTPRPGTQSFQPQRARGMYLEEPALHYSIGTKVTPNVVRDLKQYGVKQVKAHSDVPSFAPEMVRAMETLAYAPDWMVQLGGFHLKKRLLTSVHRAAGTREHQESFIPALARGVELGKAPAGAGKY